MKKFLIVDGNSIMNRAFYGLSNMRMMSRTMGIHTNALYAFLNTYWMILDRLTPDYVAVSFDLKGPTFRHKMYDDYKGTRKGMPEELAEQMPYIKELLTSMNIPIFEREGYEADDILGTVARINTEHDIFTYILTGDKDSFQLISKTTSIVIPSTRAGATEYATYTPDLLMANQEIEAYQVVHIKSLMGDASDNIPGVKGIGEKTAYTLIGKYQTLENIYEHLDAGDLDATAKIKEKLEAGREMAYLSKELATINVHVPIELDYDQCMLTDVDKPKLYELFKRLEFSKFMTKYDFSEVAGLSDSIIQEQKEKAEANLKVKKFYIIAAGNYTRHINAIQEVLKEELISYIFNKPDLDGFVHVLGMDDNFILGLYSPLQDTVYMIHLGALSEPQRQEILESFAHSKAIKAGFNVKQDILYLFNHVTEHVEGFRFDLMIAYYLMDSNRSKYDIEYIFRELYDIVLEQEKKEDTTQVQMSLFVEESKKEELLSKLEIKNLSMFLKGLYESYAIVTQRLKTLKMYSLFDEVEMPLSETLASMEHTGMYIDIDRLNEFDVMISTTIEQLEKDIHGYAGEEFNINSTQQLGEVLFHKLGLPSAKKTKTGFSTDKAVLDKISEEHPIVNKVLEYRQLMKLKTTYVDSLRDKIAEDGRIHTTFMQTVTSTGRLSSIEPNLQNIPVRIEIGRKIRSFFVGEGQDVIVDADYSQIELRVLAHISHDETMLNSFRNNIDIHKVTASQVFGVPIEEVTSTMRSHAKAVNFGIVYGISDFGLAKNIGTSRHEAAQYINNYLEKYHGIRDFMHTIVEEAKDQGYVTTLLGRRRYIPELSQKNKNIIQFGERVAMNTPIQGTAADIIKLAMNRLYAKMKEKNLKSRLVMQVHDELIVEAVPEEIETVKQLMQDAMVNVVSLEVPLNIDLNVGKSWYEAK